jgi:hypothetical protein
MLVASVAVAAEPDPGRVLNPGEKPADYRIDKPKDLNGYFPMTVPASLPEWETRRTRLREQILVAEGLWPMPERSRLQPVIHGKIDRDGYTIAKVFFASYPGHYVSGNLYRPKASGGRQPPEAKHPGVLCPHGHWANGRFYDAGEQAAREQIRLGAEKTMAGARYPLQARCAQLARMGCVVFHYDMVGVADSQQIEHRKGFLDAQANLRLQSFMGLQTFNSIRALDFLLSLPDVDPKRIGVTGASGGGTQTFTLCAIDDRPTVAFPAVMVSTAMQGGCVCENAPYLRQDDGNIDIAALFAPKPLGMTGAHDWTIDIETKGLPQLKALYRLYGHEDRVMARCFPQFEHNYNQVSREVMYNWFNTHLHLGQRAPVTEKPFVPVPPKELSVYDEEHPRPPDAVGAKGLRKYLAETSDRQLAALKPSDTASLAEFRRVLGTALRVMIHDELPGREEVEVNRTDKGPSGPVRLEKLLLGRKGQHERIPAVLLTPVAHNGTVVVWVHPDGKSSLWNNGELTLAAKQILDGHAAILAGDVFFTGELKGPNPPAVSHEYAGFTFGYNRPLLANRVHDVLTLVAYARGLKDTKTVDLLGLESAGPWVCLARALCGDAVQRTGADMNGFRFDRIRSVDDEMMLPGALKYGGLPALTALAAPGEIYLHNHRGTGSGRWLDAIYRAAGVPEHIKRSADKVTDEEAVRWLLR